MCKALKVKVASLNRIHRSTGSQWSCLDESEYLSRSRMLFNGCVLISAACVIDVMCYACNSYMAQCNFDKLASNTNNNVFQARCTSKCFTRQGEDDGSSNFILSSSSSLSSFQLLSSIVYIRNP